MPPTLPTATEPPIIALPTATEPFTAIALPITVASSMITGPSTSQPRRGGGSGSRGGRGRGRGGRGRGRGAKVCEHVCISGLQLIDYS